MDGHELKPGWTDYRHEVTFQTIDITPYFNKGTNEIRAQLSHGWWSGGISFGVYGKDVPLAFMAEIEADGKLVTSTDASWQCSHDGSLLLGDIYNGEVYDARQGAERIANLQWKTCLDSSFQRQCSSVCIHCQRDGRALYEWPVNTGMTGTESVGYRDLQLGEGVFVKHLLNAAYFELIAACCKVAHEDAFHSRHHTVDFQ